MRIIRLFEHENIRIGEIRNNTTFTLQHFEAIIRFNEHHQNKFFHIIHNGIKAKHYVGALQVKDLCIEILPKADINKQNDEKKWRDVLITLLKNCNLLDIEGLNIGYFRLYPNVILDVYLAFFLNEIEQLFRQGLVKYYNQHEGNQKVLRGRILFEKQLQNNLIRKDRFYTAYTTYDHQHLLHQIIYKALKIVHTLIRRTDLQSQLARILKQFPQQAPLKTSNISFDKIQYNQRTLRYKSAIQLARLIIESYSADIQYGQYHVLGLLFDMNRLFEEYIYNQLKKIETNNFRVLRQQSKSFWAKRSIRPDILIKTPNKNFIIDTKWKALRRAKPSMEDLRQMYVYNKYFNAQTSLLLYPNVYNLASSKAIPYNTPEHLIQSMELKEASKCSIGFIDILKQGNLNQHIGQDIQLLLSEL